MEGRKPPSWCNWLSTGGRGWFDQSSPVGPTCHPGPLPAWPLQAPGQHSTGGTRSITAPLSQVRPGCLAPSCSSVVWSDISCSGVHSDWRRGSHPELSLSLPCHALPGMPSPRTCRWLQQAPTSHSPLRTREVTVVLCSQKATLTWGPCSLGEAVSSWRRVAPSSGLLCPKCSSSSEAEPAPPAQNVGGHTKFRVGRLDL